MEVKKYMFCYEKGQRINGIFKIDDVIKSDTIQFAKVTNDRGNYIINCKNIEASFDIADLLRKGDLVNVNTKKMKDVIFIVIDEKLLYRFSNDLKEKTFKINYIITKEQISEVKYTYERE